jgi:regulator of replication initiation timing
VIGYDPALAICRTDPASAARMLCELSRELDALRKEVVALKSENAALRVECQTSRDRLQTLEEQVAKDSQTSRSAIRG